MTQKFPGEKYFWVPSAA